MKGPRIVTLRHVDGELELRLRQYSALSFWHCVRADVRGYRGVRVAASTVGFWAVLSYRAASSLRRSGLDFLAIIVQVMAQLVFGCEISRKAIVGPSLVIVHPIGVFIGPHCLLGRGCTVETGAFIGSNQSPADPDDYPTLDDKVAVATGARIMGPVVIGRESRLGPNVVVLRSVPPGSIVMPPAPRIVSRDQLFGRAAGAASDSQGDS